MRDAATLEIESQRQTIEHWAAKEGLCYPDYVVRNLKTGKVRPVPHDGPCLRTKRNEYGYLIGFMRPTLVKRMTA